MEGEENQGYQGTQSFFKHNWVVILPMQINVLCMCPYM